MTPMLEKIARAMALSEGEDYMEDYERYDGYARAGLLAMNDPDEGVLIAGCHADDPLGGLTDWKGDDDTSREGVSRVFTAMIDAILAGETGR